MFRTPAFFIYKKAPQAFKRMEDKIQLQNKNKTSMWPGLVEPVCNPAYWGMREEDDDQGRSGLVWPLPQKRGSGDLGDIAQ